ncbi:MAG: hypothetical protein M1268_04115 [Patescibacteria group bacterium]|nr:hypothetical protein [Patescibacteria group bacterium]
MKKKYIIFGAIFFLFINIILMLLTVYSKKNNIPLVTPTVKPTPIISTSIVAPTSITPPQTNPAVPYGPGSLDKTTEIINKHYPLSENDLAIKNTLINSLGGKSGSLFSNSDFIIEYAKVLGIFQVQILTENITSAKKQAVDWLKRQGMTDDGICKLPVVFYLNFDVAQKMEGEGKTLDPLPDNCIYE